MPEKTFQPGWSHYPRGGGTLTLQAPLSQREASPTPTALLHRGMGCWGCEPIRTPCSTPIGWDLVHIIRVLPGSVDSQTLDSCCLHGLDFMGTQDG